MTFVQIIGYAHRVIVSQRPLICQYLDISSAGVAPENRTMLYVDSEPDMSHVNGTTIRRQSCAEDPARITRWYDQKVVQE